MVWLGFLGYSSNLRWVSYLILGTNFGRSSIYKLLQLCWHSKRGCTRLVERVIDMGGSLYPSKY